MLHDYASRFKAFVGEKRKETSFFGKMKVAKPTPTKKGAVSLNSIILQVCQQFISEVMNFFNTGRAVSLVEIEKGLRENSDKFLREITKFYLEEMDRKIVEDKTGAKKGLHLSGGTGRDSEIQGRIGFLYVLQN